jgi:hypothetical protein
LRRSLRVTRDYTGRWKHRQNRRVHRLPHHSALANVLCGQRNDRYQERERKNEDALKWNPPPLTRGKRSNATSGQWKRCENAVYGVVAQSRNGARIFTQKRRETIRQKIGARVDEPLHLFGTHRGARKHFVDPARRDVVSEKERELHALGWVHALDAALDQRPQIVARESRNVCLYRIRKGERTNDGERIVHAAPSGASCQHVHSDLTERDCSIPGTTAQRCWGIWPRRAVVRGRSYGRRVVSYVSTLV